MNAPASPRFQFHAPPRSILAPLAVLGSVVFLCAADFDLRDEAIFRQLVAPDAKLQRRAIDMQFTEGPVWVAADGGFLVFSDIPADELKKWTAKDGLTTFR